MEHMKFETPDMVTENIDKIAALFPSAITEMRGEDGEIKRGVNFEFLKQLLSRDVVDGDECYEFTWVGKKAAMAEAARPITRTLRPVKVDSRDWDTTENLYIEGDNLKVLKILQESYLGKVKMIYIDPPYNTGNDFIYRTDGNHIMASDVKYSYDYAKECGTVTKMHYIDSVEVIGDYTVRLKTSSNAIGVWEYALTNVYIVSEKAHTESGDSFATTSCGTGPYKVGKYTPSSTLELIKKEDYWQTDNSLLPAMYKANADRVIYNVISESTQMGIAMENGSIDMILSITGSEVDRFADDQGNAYDGYNVYSTLNTLIDCMFFNMDEGSIFSDNLALRQAILYAIDTTGLVTVALDGRGEPCYAFGSSVYADYVDDWIGHDYYNQDVERAKSLLAESG